MSKLSRALLLLTMASASAASWVPLKSQPCLGRSSPGFLNSVRLEIARNAYLLQTEESRGNVLYAIRYRGDSTCPIILDSVRGSRRSNSFEYDCTVASHKGEAAVALVEFDKDGKRSAIAKAWLIEPRSLHFVPVKGKTMCSYEGYSAEDSGGDVLSRARQR
jgi:hypothetical protein